MAEVKTVELLVPQGTTFHYLMSYVDPALNDEPIDLTGYSAQMHVRAKLKDTATIYETDSSVGGHITLGGLTGKVLLEVPDEVTATWSFKRAVFDLEIVSPTGEVTRIVKGTLLLDPRVTRPAAP